MADSAEEIEKHKKLYALIGWTLGGCTMLTLLLGIWAPLDVGPPGPTPGDYVIGLGLAGFKASLVALIFMHLNHERGLIYKTLVFTVLFFISLMGLTLFNESDPIVEQFDTHKTVEGELLEPIQHPTFEDVDAKAH